MPFLKPYCFFRINCSTTKTIRDESYIRFGCVARGPNDWRSGTAISTVVSGRSILNLKHGSSSVTPP